MPDKFVYVLNAGVDSSAAISTTYANRRTEFPANAFANASVNPTIKATGISDENGTTSSSISVNCFEIRTAPFDGRLVGDADSQILNRVYPSSSTVTEYGSNKETTSNYSIRIYDDAQASTGKKIILNGTATSDEVLLDMANYDYFVLINPETTYTSNDGSTLTSIRPHFAKIKSLRKHDVFGDAFEFTPAYGGELDEDTNFEIYKGPAKTDTDVVAVAYGLRGDTTAIVGTVTNFLTDKYDVFNTVSRPTFYFYNDRLENENQLDYDTKHQLVSARWWADWTSVQSKTLVADPTNSAIYAGTKTVDWSSAPTSAIPIGTTLWVEDSGKKMVGNISARTTTTEYTIDNLRTALPATKVAYVGRSYCYPCFRTEQEFGSNVNDIGPLSVDAVIVDNVKVKDDTSTPIEDLYANNTYTFVPENWKDAFRNMNRSTRDRNSKVSTGTPDSHIQTTSSATTSQFANEGTSAYIHANLTGPKRYIEYQKSPDKTNYIPQVIENLVNDPMSEISKMARLKAIDSSGLLSTKIKTFDKLLVNSLINTGDIKFVNLPGKVNTSGSTLLFSELESNIDLSYLLATGDIILVNDYYYKLGTVTTKAVPGDTIQNLPVAAYRHKNSNFFTTSTTPQTHENITAKVYAWNNSKLKTNITIDSVVNHTEGNRLTIDNKGVLAKETSISNYKIVLDNGQMVGAVEELDYGDKIHNYVVPKNLTKNLYNPTPSQYLQYYSGGFRLIQEIFNGEIEQIESSQERGIMELNISGRDETTDLLGAEINKNLLFQSDIIYSGLLPQGLTTAPQTMYTSSTVNKAVSISGTGDVTSNYPKGTLLFLSGVLVGEVASSNAITFGGTTNTTITLTDNRYSNISTSSGSPSTIQMLSPNNANYIASKKAIQTNKNSTTKPTSLLGASSKGLVFNDGRNIDITQSTLTSTDLFGSSATGGVLLDKTLGYHIHGLKSIKNTEQPNIMFKIGKESPFSNTLVNTQPVASMSQYNVVETTSTDETTAEITLAPSLPIYAGIVKENTSDTRNTGDSNLYLLNSQGLPLGGIIHEINSSYENYPIGTGNIVYYNDLCRFTPNSLRYNDVTNTRYTNMNSQSFSAYLPGYAIKNDLSIISDISGTSLSPIQGSNFWDYTSHTGMTVPAIQIKEYFLADRNSQDWDTVHSLDLKTNWQALDAKAFNYKLFGLGDIFLDSYLRPNNIGYSDGTNNHDFSQMGIILQSREGNENTVNHQKFDGTTAQSKLSDSNFERLQIISSDNTPNAIRRFGVVRLVEATFDWHFNPVNGETLTKIDEDGINNKIIMTKDSTSDKYNRYFRNVLPVLVGTVVSHSEGSTTIELSSVSGLSVSSPDITILYREDGTVIGKINSISSPNVVVANLKGVQHLENGSNIYYIKSTKTNYYPLHTWEIYGQEDLHLTDNAIGRDEDIYFNSCFIINDQIDKDYLEFCSTLYTSVTSAGAEDNYYYFHLGQVMLPILFKPEANFGESYAANVSAELNMNPYLSEKIWADSASSDNSTTQEYYHPSRVVSALQEKSLFNTNTSVNYINSASAFTETSDSVEASFYYMGRGNPYRNCSMVIFDSRLLFNESKASNIQGGTTYFCDSTNFEIYANDAVDDVHHNQHHNSIFTEALGNNKTFKLLSTVAPFRMYSKKSNEKLRSYGGQGLSTSTDPSSEDHDVSSDTSNTGSSMMAQFLIKPQFNVADTTTVANHPNKDAVLDVNGDGLTWKFKIGTTGTHNWLTFAPNLEGHFLVSNRGKPYQYGSHNGEKENIWFQNVFRNPPPPTSTYNNEFEIWAEQSDNWLVTAWSSTSNPHEITVTSVSGLATGDKLYKYGTFEYVGKVGSVNGSTNKITLDNTNNGHRAGGANRPEIYLEQYDKLFVGKDQSWVIANKSVHPENQIIPDIISKITSHTYEFNNTDDCFYHTIVVDKALTKTQTAGCTYRLMKIADDFKPPDMWGNTWEKRWGLELFNLRNLQRASMPYYLDSEGSWGNHSSGNEGILSIYLPIEIDEGGASNYIVKRTMDNFLRPDGSNYRYADGETIDCYITDGNLSERRTIGINGGNNNYRLTGFFESREDALNYKGVVSFGEIFTLKTSNFSMSKPKTANIGTTYCVTVEAEEAIQEMLEENGISMDNNKTKFTYTGILTSGTHFTANKTVITTTTAVSNEISVGDKIYNLDYELVGEVESISSSSSTNATCNTTDGSISITHSNNTGFIPGLIVNGPGIPTDSIIVEQTSFTEFRINNPATATASSITVTFTTNSVTLTQEAFGNLEIWNEILTYSTKSLFLGANFNKTDLFSAINYCASQKGLGINVKNNKINLYDLEDRRGFERQSLSYKEHQKFVISVESDESLFNYANKITVVGDGVSSTVQKEENRKTKALKVLDTKIKSVAEARLKAERLLDIHTSDTKKIIITINKKGIENVKAGDIISLNFPKHGIFKDDYVVFEVGNVLADNLELTVGKYSKSIAHRLAELGKQSSNLGTTLLTKKTIDDKTNRRIYENISFKPTQLIITHTSLAGQQTLAWNTIFGWNRTMGWGTVSQTIQEVDL